MTMLRPTTCHHRPARCSECRIADGARTSGQKGSEFVDRSWARPRMFLDSPRQRNLVWQMDLSDFETARGENPLIGSVTAILRKVVTWQGVSS